MQRTRAVRIFEEIYSPYSAIASTNGARVRGRALTPDLDILLID
jgi:hypothetical protein